MTILYIEPGDMTRYMAIYGVQANGEAYFGFGTSSGPMVCAFLPAHECHFNYFKGAFGGNVMVSGIKDDYLMKMAFTVFCVLHLGKVCDCGDKNFLFPEGKLTLINHPAKVLKLLEPGHSD